MPDTDPPLTGVPHVQDRRGKVPGILPRNAQAWVLSGLAVLMVAVIMLSGKNAPQEHKSAAPRPSTVVTETNQARIQEYRAQIEEQARRLVAEQAQLQRTKEALGVPSAPGTVSGSPAAPTAPSARPYAAYPSPAPAEPGVDAPEIHESRGRKGLFASNIALSYRKDPAPPATALTPASLPLAYSAAWPESSSLAIGFKGAGDPHPAMAKPTGSASEAGPPSSDADEGPGTIHRTVDPELMLAEGKMYRLFEGTVIETVLTNRLDGTFSGPVNCMVTTSVYSHDRQHLLIPQGTRVLGEVRKLASFGEQRLAVFFHRLVMPDGFSVSLDKFQGLSQVGETGLRDLVNHHYLEVFGVSLAIGAIAGLSQANTQYGLDASPTDAYRQGVANSLSQTSMHILDRYLNVLPTFTIREGQRVKVYLSNDLALPAYDRHQLPSDL